MGLAALSQPKKVLWDARHQSYLARILPGEFHVSEEGEAIATVLGSCVSACVRDRGTGVGGMNHFMLPLWSVGSSEVWTRLDEGAALRFGNYAMEALLNALLARGAHRGDLEVKLFGGGRMFDSNTDIGAANARFATEYVRDEGLELVATDLGGDSPRQLVYFPVTGRARVRRLPPLARQQVRGREMQLARELEAKPTSGGVELF